jgi:opacity protein-like surface antigen
VILVLSFAAVQAEAQFPLAIAAGPVFASTSHENASSKTGFFIGAGTSFAINERISIDPFAAFVQKGATFDGGGFDENINVLEIPIFFTANFPVNETVSFSLSAGPQIGFILSCTYEDESDSDDCEDVGDVLKSFEFGIIGGAQVNFPVTDTLLGSVGAGMDYGLTDIFEDYDEKTRTYYLYAALGIPIGG